MSLRSAWRLRGPLVAALLATAVAACASDDAPRYRGGPVELRVGENWDLLVEEPADSFFETVGRNAEEFADPAGKGTAVVGCVAGAVTLVVLTQAQSGEAGEAGCMVGGYALYPVGYAMGYGTGAVVGTVQGTINAFTESEDEIDTRALLEAFENATPRSDLAKALFAQSQPEADLSFTWGAGPDEAGRARPHTDREPAAELTLAITRHWLSTTTIAPPRSRLHLTVSGRLRDSQSGRRILDGKWRYVSELLPTAELAGRNAERLKTEMAKGWQELAGEIVADLFGPADL